MTRHPTARRVHRQETSGDDAFVAGVLETSVWARQHQRLLIIGGIALAVIVTALVLWLTSRASQRDQAALEISQVRAVALSGNTLLAIRELEQFVSRYGRTPAGREARLLLAGAYMDGGRYSDAASTVQPLGRDVDGDLGVNAALLLAAAQEATGEAQRAEETYLRVGNGARFLFQRQEALDNVARLRLQRGDVAGAVQMYERILSITPEDSPDRQVFDLRLGELQARAVSAQGTQPDQVPAAPAPGAPAAAPGLTPGLTPGATPAPDAQTPPPGGTQPPPEN
jgi:predicted negative regulator of RcsB-dependent stress response